MNNGVNDGNNNQAIPGVRVAMPNAKPVDASTTDVGAALSNAQRVNEQPTASAAVIQGSVQPVGVTTPVVNSNIPVVPASPTIVATQPTIVASTVQSTTQPVAIAVQAPPIIQSTTAPAPVETVSLENVVTNDEGGKRKKEKKSKLSSFLIFVILLLGITCGFLWFYHQQEMAKMRVKCTPVSTSGESKKLDLDSTIVKDLYSKVATTIREDLGEVNLTDQLKIYLAYRQIGTSKLYESNCNKFSVTSMEPFTCELTASFVPKAFKEDVLQVELKKLFGDDTNIPNQNIQLGNTCIGGFQYIEERGEYVQGQCGSTGATLYRVEKELIDATSTESTIVLTEKVKYYGAEALALPDRLVSGTYKYIFKLDMNYNYIYVSKELAN